MNDITNASVTDAVTEPTAVTDAVTEPTAVTDAAPKKLNKRQGSFSAQTQTGGTCAIHSIARCIMKLIQTTIPEEFKLTEIEYQELYGDDSKKLSDFYLTAVTKLTSFLKDPSIYDNAPKSVNVNDDNNHVIHVLIAETDIEFDLQLYTDDAQLQLKQLIAEVDRIKLAINKIQYCNVVDNVDDIIVQTYAELCPIKSRANYIKLYYHIFKCIETKYTCGMSVMSVIRVMCSFLHNINQSNDGVNINQSNDVDVMRMLNAYHTYNKDNEITVDVASYMYNGILDENSHFVESDTCDTTHRIVNNAKLSDFYTNIPYEAKKSLNSNLYAIFAYNTSNAKMNRIMNADFTPDSAHELASNDSSAHAMVITKLNNENITILNSWGKYWGDDGAITFNASEFSKIFSNNTNKYLSAIIWFNVKDPHNKLSDPSINPSINPLGGSATRKCKRSVNKPRAKRKRVTRKCKRSVKRLVKRK